MRQDTWHPVSAVQSNRWKCDVGQLTESVVSIGTTEHSIVGKHKLSEEESAESGEIHFYDSVTGKELFVAPRGRSFAALWRSLNPAGLRFVMKK